MGKHSRNRSIGAGAGAVGVSIVAAAALYALSRKRERSPFTLALWKQALAENGQVTGFTAILEHVSEKGIDLDAKRQMWPHLLGVFDASMSHSDKQALEQEFRVRYEALISFCEAREAEIMSYTQDDQEETVTPRSSENGTGTSSSPSPAAADGDPSQLPASRGERSLGQSSQSEVSKNPFNAVSRADLPEELRQFYEAQRIIVMDAVRTDFKKNSLTTADAIASWLSAALSDSQIYQKLSAKDDWWSGYWVSALAKYQLDHSSHFSSEQKRQVLRLVNLLSAYAVHDPETGYCQGMSDLAIPFLLLIEDDALAFMCFDRLMQKVRRNFAVEDSGIFAQLACLASLLERLDPTLFYKIRQMGATDCHFAYRMIVVLLRRELNLDQALRLWEMLWADDMLRAVGPNQELGATHDSNDVKTPSTPTALGSAAGQDFDESLDMSPARALTEAITTPSPTPRGQVAKGNMEDVLSSKDLQDMVKCNAQEPRGICSPTPTPRAQHSSNMGASEGNDNDANGVGASSTSVAATPVAPETAEASQSDSQGTSPPTCPSDIFSYFVAAVVISQRRWILDDCHDSDDMLKHFQTLRVDVNDCMLRAKQYRGKLGGDRQ